MVPEFALIVGVGFSSDRICDWKYNRDDNRLFWRLAGYGSDEDNRYDVCHSSGGIGVGAGSRFRQWFMESDFSDVSRSDTGLYTNAERSGNGY